MFNTAAIPDTTFIVRGLNNVGITQPTDANKQVFASENTLDTAANTVVPAKDRPYLTMNDKVFAARYTISSVSPNLAEFETGE